MRSRIVRTTALGARGEEGLIRPARAGDVPALTRIMPLAFRAGSVERAQYASREGLGLMVHVMDSTPARQAWMSFLVAERGGEVVGAATFRYGMHSSQPLRTPVYQDLAILDTLAVAEGHQGAGVGRALLRRAEADMRGAGSRVMALQCPESAAGFYQACKYVVEPVEVACMTVFPRQGQQVFTTSRAVGEPGARVAWRGLTGSRVRVEPYVHPEKGEQAVAVRGVIPGDLRRVADWPRPVGYRLVGAASGGSV